VYGASEGVELSYGLFGSQSWKHTTLSVNFHGDFRDYAHASYYDGTDQNLQLQLRQQLSQHVQFELSVGAGTYNNRFGLYLPTGYYDPLIAQTSIADLFDNRTIFLQTTGRLVYRKSARLSFSFGGGGFLTRRRSSALFGDTGYLANADAVYRLTRMVSIGADYAYYHYDFLRVFGSSDIHTAAVNLSYRFAKRWEFGLRGGVFRAENLLLAVVPVDPVIAAITGQTSGIIANYNIIYSPVFNVRLSHGFQGGNCSVTYNRGVTPGNGVFLTSRQDVGSLDCTYTAQRHWNLGAGVAYYALSALEQSVGQYRTGDAHAGVTRSLGRDLHFVWQFDAIDDLTNYAAFRTRIYYRVSIGLSYSPGARPLSLW